MKKILIILIIAMSSIAVAQKVHDLPNKSFQFDLGVSKNGSGDLSGYSINSEFNNYFAKKMSFSMGLGATLHDGETSVSDRNNAISTLRYTVAGFQLTGKIGYSFIRNNKNDFGLRLGTVLRFQSYSTSSIGYDSTEGIAIYNDSPQRTLAFGGIIQLYYNYNINQKLFVGTSGTFQTDTNGDAISQLSLTCGMRF
jgi:hypothetical protein